MKTLITALMFSAAAMTAAAVPAQAQSAQETSSVVASGVFQDLAATAHEKVGLALHQDDFTGTTLALPMNFVEPVGPTEVGYHWAGTENGEIHVETLRIAEEGSTLESLYATLSADTADRTVTHAQFGDDWFVVTAEADGIKMYMRVSAQGNDLRGFSVSYESDMAEIIEPAIAVMIGSFDPFRTPAATGEAQDYVAGLAAKRVY